MPTLKRALPKSVRIGSVDCKIILKDFDTRSYMGMFVPMKAEIHINDDEGFVERTSVAWLAIFNQLKDKI